MLTLAEEKVQIKDYGEARQLTLFEDGALVLQMLTCDPAAPPAALSWLKSRWRKENLFKYASEGNYGIDKICDYAASHRRQKTPRSPLTPPAKPRTPPPSRARKKEEIAAAERAFAALLADPDTHRRRQERCDPRRREQDHHGQEHRHRSQDRAQGNPR